MVRILLDSSSDITIEEAKKKGIDLLPLSITLEGTEYRDGVTLERNDFFEMLTKTKEFPKTSQPAPDEFIGIFEDVKAAGDEMVCILLSSALSGTYQSAVLARQLVGYDGIYVVDSLTATFCITLLADEACRLRDAGASGAEIADAVKKLRPRVRVIAALDTLEYLQKGGRISRTVAAAGTLVNLKPVITITQEGTVSLIGKCIGKNKAASHMIAHLEKLKIDSHCAVYSIYSYGTKNLEAFEERLKSAGIAFNRRLQIGPTIGAHIGPGAFGLIYAEL